MPLAVLVFTDIGSIVVFMSSMTILWRSTRNQKKTENGSGDDFYHYVI
jgi:hypothetical protein